jgi:hypothetical protein
VGFALLAVQESGRSLGNQGSALRDVICHAAPEHFTIGIIMIFVLHKVVQVSMLRTDVGLFVRPFRLEGSSNALDGIDGAVKMPKPTLLQ